VLAVITQGTVETLNLVVAGRGEQQQY
jgi:hypothetical protein